MSVPLGRDRDGDELRIALRDTPRGVELVKEAHDGREWFRAVGPLEVPKDQIAALCKALWDRRQ